jgi:hypothetical protein
MGCRELESADVSLASIVIPGGNPFRPSGTRKLLDKH